MAATGNAPLEQEIGDRNECPVAASQHLYRGSMAFGDAAGLATTVLGAKFLGHMVAEADNSAGADGAINAVLMAGRYRLQVTLTGVALTDIGAPVFASDNNTLTLTPGANTPVGKVLRYVAANTAIVEFAPMQFASATIANAPAGGVGVADGAWDTAAHRDAAIATINAIVAALEAAGITLSS